MNQDDFDALYAVLADPDIMQHYPYAFDEERVQNWIERNINRYRKRLTRADIWTDYILKNPAFEEKRMRSLLSKSFAHISRKSTEPADWTGIRRIMKAGLRSWLRILYGSLLSLERPLDRLCGQGLLYMPAEGRYALTDRGIDVSNMVLSEFLLG